jgi:hypothetical protein
MGSDNMNYPESGSIAQAIKHQIRAGSCWDDRSPAEKESLDQIATAIARMVVGDGVHWDAIINYAQVAKPSTADLPMTSVPSRKPGHLFDQPSVATRVGLEAIERSIREDSAPR